MFAAAATLFGIIKLEGFANTILLFSLRDSFNILSSDCMHFTFS